MKGTIGKDKRRSYDHTSYTWLLQIMEVDIVFPGEAWRTFNQVQYVRADLCQDKTAFRTNEC